MNLFPGALSTFLYDTAPVLYEFGGRNIGVFVKYLVETLVFTESAPFCDFIHAVFTGREEFDGLAHAVSVEKIQKRVSALLLEYPAQVTRTDSQFRSDRFDA